MNASYHFFSFHFHVFQPDYTACPLLIQLTWQSSQYTACQRWSWAKSWRGLLSPQFNTFPLQCSTLSQDSYLDPFLNVPSLRVQGVQAPAQKSSPFPFPGTFHKDGDDSSQRAEATGVKEWSFCSPSPELAWAAACDTMARAGLIVFIILNAFCELQLSNILSE